MKFRDSRNLLFCNRYRTGALHSPVRFGIKKISKFQVFSRTVPGPPFSFFFRHDGQQVDFGTPSESTGLPKWLHKPYFFQLKNRRKASGALYFSRSGNRLASKTPPGACKTSFFIDSLYILEASRAHRSRFFMILAKIFETKIATRGPIHRSN